MYNKLFHINVFMPIELLDKVKQLQKNIETIEFSRHLQEQCINRNDYKHYLDPVKIEAAIKHLKDTPINPFEVQVSKDYFKLGPGWFITKYVVRVSYDILRDITFVISFKFKENEVGLDKTHAFIKTAWLNDKTDIHTTLDKSKYNTKF